MTINGDYQRFIVENRMLLREFLSERLSNRALKAAKMKGKIYVNGIFRTVRHPLEIGDVVEVYYPDESKASKVSCWYFYLHKVYEDGKLMVIYKMPGMPSIPNRRYPNYTLANVLAGYYEMNHIPSAIHLVSRLDKDTSGLLLVSKNRRYHHLMTGKVKRKYLFLVEGVLEGEGTINLPIRDVKGTIKREINSLGKPSVTHYRSLWHNEEISLVEAQLETGRTHQIRVHFSSVNHPLLGDKLYGKAHPLFNGQALHSYELSFIHPESQELLCFRRPPIWWEIFKNYYFDIEFEEMMEKGKSRTIEVERNCL